MEFRWLPVVNIFRGLFGVRWGAGGGAGVGVGVFRLGGGLGKSDWKQSRNRLPTSVRMALVSQN